MTDAIPCLILGGYLGAGKTTLINGLLSRHHGKQITVLVNDFGAINIDAALINNKDGDTLSLTNGCACCSIGDSLLETADRVVRGENPPDLLLVEASGAAEPGRMKQILMGVPGLKAAQCLTVVDASTFQKRLRDKFVGKLVRAQLKQADCLYINRLAEGKEPEDPVLASLNKPRMTSAQEVFRYLGALGAEKTDLSVDLGAEKEAAEALQTFTLPIPADMERKDLQAKLTRLPTSIHRLKGILTLKERGADQVFTVQGNGQDCTFVKTEPRNRDIPSGLVLIGPVSDQDRRRITDLLTTAQL